MEVHRHTHSATHRKSWSHYFWEFFMLFLAVFAGFIAENQREHFIEHKRARQFALAVYNDIKADTVSLRNILQFTEDKIRHIDSLIYLLHLPPGSRHDSVFTTHFTSLMKVQVFERNRTTYEQLKNSGTLRYFNQSIINLLNRYEVAAEEVYRRENAETDVLLYRAVAKVMETINMEAVYEQMFNKPRIARVYVKIKDPDKVDILVNEAVGIKILRTRLIGLYGKLQEQAAGILAALKAKYRLE